MPTLYSYATLEQMQQMMFGCSGHQRNCLDADAPHDAFELLVDDVNGLAGWARRYNDADGALLDWDRLSYAEALKVGLDLTMFPLRHPAR